MSRAYNMDTIIKSYIRKNITCHLCGTHDCLSAEQCSFQGNISSDNSELRGLTSKLKQDLISTEITIVVVRILQIKNGKYNK